jgi:hypothetical protein
MSLTVMHRQIFSFMKHPPAHLAFVAWLCLTCTHKSQLHSIKYERLLSDNAHAVPLAKSKRSRSYSNKSLKQSKKSARGLVGKKGQDRRAPAGRKRLGGGGTNPHPPSKPTPTATPEPVPAPGSLEERLVKKGTFEELI